MAFEGSRLKIDRANKHIEDLNAELADSVRRHECYRLSVDKDPNTGNSLLNFSPSGSLPRHLATIIGDAIHNVRSALDLAWYELIEAQIPARLGQWTMFPFKKSEDELIRAMRDEEMKTIPDLFKLMIDVVRPYPGGNDTLCSLHQLDIADKHKLIIPVLQLVALRGVNLEDDRGNRFVNLTIMGDRPFIPIATGGNLQIKSYGEAAIHLFFDKGLPMEGEPIIPALKQFTGLVGKTIAAFEGLGLGRKI